MISIRFICILTSIFLASCTAGPARQSTSDEMPYLEVLSKNDHLITIEHNAGGEDMALRYAYEKCESIGKKSIYQYTSKQYDSQLITTWKCIEID